MWHCKTPEDFGFDWLPIIFVRNYCRSSIFTNELDFLRNNQNFSNYCKEVYV